MQTTAGGAGPMATTKHPICQKHNNGIESIFVDKEQNTPTQPQTSSSHWQHWTLQWSVRVDNNLHAGDPELSEEPGDPDDQECELDARVLAPLFVSVSGRTLFWIRSLATTRIIPSSVEMRESDIAAVELAALRHELAVDPLRWFADFAMEKHWHSSDSAYQQLQGLIKIWYTAGTFDQFNLGGVAAVEELARQVQSCVDAHSDLGRFTFLHWIALGW